MKRLVFFSLFFMSAVAYANTITIGTSSYAPPLAYKIAPPNHYSGFEVSTMRAVCSRININCRFRTIKAADIREALNKGTIDLAVEQIIVPSQPLDGFVFSRPYLNSSAQFMTLKNSSISTPKELRQKRIGVRRGSLEDGTLFAAFILKLYDGQLTILDYSNMHDLLSALDHGKVDAIFANSSAILYYVGHNEKQYKTIGAAIPIGDGYGAMATVKNVDLMRKINQALLDMKNDGQLDKLFQRYFGLQPPVKRPT